MNTTTRQNLRAEKPAARAAFNRHLEDARAAVAKITAALDAEETKFKNARLSWADAETMGHHLGMLSEISDSMNNEGEFAPEAG